MKNLYLTTFCLIILSCGSNDESKTKAAIDSSFKHIDSIAKGPQLTKIKPLPAQLGFTVSLIDEETYNKAVDNGIKFVRDTSDFKKLNGKLELYHDSKKVYEFIDSANAHEPDTAKVWDNVDYRAEGYYIINGRKWYRVASTGYEWGTIILIPPPYDKTYAVMSGGGVSEPFINPSGNYLFDLYWSPLFELRGEWSLYNIANSKLDKISSHILDCRCGNGHIKSEENSILCPEIKGVKWISDKELLIKVENPEGNDKDGQQIIRSGYLKLTIK